MRWEHTRPIRLVAEGQEGQVGRAFLKMSLVIPLFPNSIPRRLEFARERDGLKSRLRLPLGERRLTQISSRASLRSHIFCFSHSTQSPDTSRPCLQLTSSLKVEN
jgi:hypothetical protein